MTSQVSLEIQQRKRPLSIDGIFKPSYRKNYVALYSLGVGPKQVSSKI
jgi:hypothetical protein